MFNSVRPQRWQPTRLPRPWDSPGKNTGVGCYFLLRCMKVKVKLLSRVRLLVTPWTAAYQVPPSMGSSRQEYWSGVPLPSPLSRLVTSNFVTLWTVACQTPVSMRFPRVDYLNGLSCPPPGDLPNPGIKPVAAALAGRFFPTEPPGKSLFSHCQHEKLRPWQRS